MSQYVRFSLVQETGKLGQLGPQLIGHSAPLGLGRLGVILGEGGGDEAETTRRPLFPAWASASLMKWTRQLCHAAFSTLEIAAFRPSWTGAARAPLRKGDRLSDKIEEQLASIKRMPQLIRSFFKAPTVAYINDC
jgi:hypothetical protein